jgi:hypothetical protein
MIQPLIGSTLQRPCMRRMRPVHFHQETNGGTSTNAPMVTARIESTGLLLASFSSPCARPKSRISRLIR